MKANTPQSLFLASIITVCQAMHLAAQTPIYSQTSLAASGGGSPGLFDQFGMLGGTNSPRADFFEIFENTTGSDQQISGAVLYGSVAVNSTASLVPVFVTTVNGVPNILAPDLDPGHVLTSVSVPVGPMGGPGAIAISFSSPVLMPSGTKLAFGFTVPMSGTVDATLFGTDTLPGGLSASSPRHYTGFYFSKAGGDFALGSGNHYLVIETVPEPATWALVIMALSLTVGFHKMNRAKT